MSLQVELDIDIGKKRQEIAKLEQIKALIQEFPDLQRCYDRWKNVYYVSAKVNSIADKVHFRHSCGCCNDSPLYAMAYIEHPSGIAIYATPHQFEIGQKNEWGYGELPAFEWKEKMQKMEFNQKVIDECESYLNAHRPKGVDEDTETIE